MDLSPLLGELGTADKILDPEEGRYRDLSLPEGAAVPLAAQLCSHTDLQLIVTPSGHEAEEFADRLKYFLPPSAAEVFPAWETLPHERLSPRADTVARRLSVLHRLAHPEEYPPLKAVVMPVRALLQPIAENLGSLRPVILRAGMHTEIETLTEQLTAAAYTRADMVGARGQFAVRGGIVDIFPPTEPHPLRVEFFGDEVEEIRAFSVADQRSLHRSEVLRAPACRELLLTDEVRARAASRLADFPGAAEMLDKIANGIPTEGMESLLPILVPKMECVLEEFPQSARVLFVCPERIETHAESLSQTTAEFLAAAWSNAAAGGEVPLEVTRASFLTLPQVRELIGSRGRSLWTMCGLRGENAEDTGLRETPDFAGRTEQAFAFLRELTRGLWKIVLFAQSAGSAERLLEQLGESDVPARIMHTPEEGIKPGVVCIVTASLPGGFMAESKKIAVFSAQDILHRVRRSPGSRGKTAMPARRGKTVDPLSLKPGDYVVHERHGIGRFVKLVKRSVGGVNGTQREYVVLEYASGRRKGVPDELWVPTDQLYLVSKYVGGDKPALNKMGGSDWAKTKSKARAAVKQIAKELIRLYARRRATRGHAFGPDTPWQRELEDAFEFTETPDQIATVEEVKRDMESPEPMDRLISGDVGYGKTEIAVRAAFKAVQDGKQVAVLVPTTLLVQQHLETFRERFAGFPVTVEGLSRFQTQKETRAVKEGTACGKIDVVIGTHKLITGEVRFKDLGLVIIDEEQRFGVEHKETLKQMYPAVDVLAMSATPIPRTLEMAVTGIRQMSTLATPPEERHPVLTYVGVQDGKQIVAAVKRELLRDGQVFYIHNRTETIARAAENLSRMIPGARIGVAHGKMSEQQLETVIGQFWEKEIDVLVCTTIVETGLDISNANTLIVEDARKLGLSQLHQLRGRVGRGRERAYAYFLYPPGKVMTETAIERLRTIAAHTELGAGIQVALKDLEIRGAGNLLGGEQSGHIAGVGFDLYIRMVSEAVAKLTGQTPQTETESGDVRIELPVDAFVPASWVASERLRLEIYTKISAAQNDCARADISAELTDRYGPLPREVERLLRISKLRETARAAGIGEIAVFGNTLRLSPVQLSDFRLVRLKRLYPKSLPKPAIRALAVPLREAGNALSASACGTPINEELLDFTEKLIYAVFIAE